MLDITQYPPPAVVFMRSHGLPACHVVLQGQLEAHESVATHTLADLPSISSSSTNDAAELPTMLLIDTAGCEFDEQQEQDGDSRYNQGEAQAALAYVQRLLAAGLAPTDIGIITPYSAQVQVGLMFE
jgi:superfamily I DNA and/or RNA helicase